MLETGEVVGGRYVIEDLLGEGGLAQVWRVRHAELGSHHALKVLLFKKPRLAERLILEGRIQAQLRHPNIVAVNDVVRHNGRVGLLMEFVDGVSLDAYLHRYGKLALDPAMEMFGAILAGVTAAHLAGVLHRDLKPANILLAKGSRGLVPKVTDFGIAKVVEGTSELGSTRIGAVMGTPGYLAPEQAKDASGVDHRADIFALGAIFYEVLAGTRAFDVDSVEATASQTPAPLSDLEPSVPDHIDWAIHRAMSTNPDDRYPTVDAFAEDLFKKHPGLLRGIRDMPELSSRSLVLSLPSSVTTGSGKTPTPLTPTASVPQPTIAPLTIAPSPPEDDSGRWLAMAVLGIVALVGVALLRQPPASTQPPTPVQAPTPVAAPAASRPAPTPAAAPVATPAPVTPAPEAVPPEPTQTPTRATPTPAVVEAEPDEAPAPEEPVDEPEAAPEETDPAEATPAPEEDAVAAVELPDPEPPAEPERPAVPSVIGTWTGKAEGRPTMLVVTTQNGNRLTGELRFTLGTTERRYEVAGDVDGKGVVVLREPGGTMVVGGTFVEGTRFDGNYRFSNQKKTQALSLAWNP